MVGSRPSASRSRTASTTSSSTFGRHHGAGMGPPHPFVPARRRDPRRLRDCRKRGFKVMAHATNPDAVKNAIRLGAHSVEHGYIMDDECIALLLEHDTWYVPTLAISHLTASQATNRFEAAWVAERGLRMRCVAVPRQPRTCTPRGSARRSMPVCEWHWAPTSVLSRRPRCSRWGCGSATARRRGRRW